GSFLDLGAVRELARLPLPDLDYPPHRGGAPIEEGRTIFATLAERDILVHHPYDAFEATVQRLVVEAADDPDVVAIKLTLYRAGGRSEDRKSTRLNSSHVSSSYAVFCL